MKTQTRDLRTVDIDMDKQRNGQIERLLGLLVQ